MSHRSLQLEITLPRLTAAELSFLIQWSGSKHDTFPAFGRFVCEVATDELARRMNVSDEPGMTPLPELVGQVASDFLLGSYVLSRMPLSEGVAAFVDDLTMKTVSDIAGRLEHEAVA